MRGPQRASILSFAIVLTTALSTVPNGAAFAQAGPDAARRAQLIRQAEQADGANDHVHALELAEQAAQISMSTSLRLFLTEQQLALGRVVEALANAEACAQEAEANAQLVNRAVILAECRRSAQTLATRVGRLIVRPPSPAPAGLHVSIAGHEIDPTRFNLPQPVAPGTIILDASAEGRAPIHREITVSAGATVDIALAFEPAHETSPQATATTASSSPAPHVQPPPEPSHSVVPYVVAGAGILSLGASLAFYLLRNDALSRLDANCTVDSSGISHCFDTHDNRARYDDARAFAGVSIVTLVTGGVLVAGGVAWWLYDHRRHQERSMAYGLAPLPGGAVVQIGGAF